jgi:hypothetical protein
VGYRGGAGSDGQEEREENRRFVERVSMEVQQVNWGQAKRARAWAVRWQSKQTLLHLVYESSQEI